MAHYFNKVVRLNGMIAVHWSEMEVGQEYLSKIKLPRIKRYYSGVNKGKSEKIYDTYYLIGTL